MKASSTAQVLATETRTHRQWKLNLCTPVSYSRYTKSSSCQKKTVGWEKKITFTSQISACVFMQTHKDRHAWTHTDYRHKNRCLQTYAYMLHTHTHENTNSPANTDVSRQTWTYAYIWRSISASKYATLFSTHGDTSQGLKSTQNSLRHVDE